MSQSNFTINDLQDEVTNMLCAATFWSSQDRELAAEIIKAMRGDKTSTVYHQMMAIITPRRQIPNYIENRVK